MGALRPKVLRRAFPGKDNAERRGFNGRLTPEGAETRDRVARRGYPQLDVSMGALRPKVLRPARLEQARTTKAVMFQWAPYARRC